MTSGIRNDLKGQYLGSVLTAYLIDIVVTDLKKTKIGRFPEHFVMIYIDKEEKWRSEKLRKTLSPRWQENVPISFQPSSSIKIELLRSGSLLHRGDSVLLGRFTGQVVDLIENDAVLHLKDEKMVENDLQMKVKLTLDAEPSDLDIKMADIDDSIARMDGTASFSAISKYVDTSTSVVSAAQAAYESAQTFGSSIAPLGQALESLQQIVNVVDGFADLHPICKAAWTLLSCVYKALQKQMRQDDDIRELAESLRETLAIANECPDLRVIKGSTDVIREMGRAVMEATALVDEYVRLPFLGRVLKSSISTDFATRIQNSRKRFADLNTKFDRRLGIDTNKEVKDIKEALNTKAMMDLIDLLPRVAKAKYTSELGCLKGTRREIIDAVVKWAAKTGSGGTKVFWLRGQAGMGKTAIATSISCALSDVQWLGGTFFFRRQQEKELREPGQVFSSIAYQMTTTYQSVCEAIFVALGTDRDIGKYTPSDQFKNLIQGPLRSTADLQHPVVILLDALDECAEEEDQHNLLRIIYGGLPLLPDIVKFVITSRPHPDLEATFAAMHPYVESFDLTTYQANLVDRDITTFITFKLAEVARSHGLEYNWPGADIQKVLVQRAKGLFQWAKVACDVIKDNDSDGPDAQLKFILDTPLPSDNATISPWAVLDNLYLEVLKRALTPNTPLGQLQDVLGALLVALDPLSSHALGRLLDLRPSIVKQRLRKLHSVILVPATDDSMLGVIHPSFVDLLTDRSRCTDLSFYIEPMKHHGHLARRCLLRMQDLKRDICGLGRAPKMNSEIPKLDEKLTRYVPDDLRYACRFWAEHLFRSSNQDSQLYELVQTFASHSFLHWLEVLSLTGLFDTALPSLLAARTWVQVACNNCRQDVALADLLKDGQRLVREFRDPIVASAAQLYISALPFSPRSTQLFKSLSDQYKSTVNVPIGAEEKWTRCIATLEGHGDEVHAVAMSPKGIRVVSGSSNGTVRVWDTQTGAGTVVVSAETCHATVFAVAFSPSGKHVIAAAGDGLIYLRDTSNPGVGAAFKWPIGMLSLAFSHDGSRVLCGSYEKQVTDNFDEIVTYSISSIMFSLNTIMTRTEDSKYICTSSPEKWLAPFMAFSPDGTLLAIRIRTCGVQVWDSRTVTPIGPVLEAHMRNVAFSAGGTQMVSHTTNEICVWDLKTGSLISTLRDPLGLEITAVALSPSGNQIASGHGASSQGPVQIWDVNTKSCVGVPLAGHSKSVIGLAYSPDGSHIVSCSADGTLRIWDASMDVDEPAGDVVQENTSAISKVAFSPAGNQWVSCSGGGELLLCVGAASSKLNEGYDPSPAYLLQFSPDGQHIATLSGYGLRIWNTNTRTFTKPINYNGRIEALTFSPNGNHLLFAAQQLQGIFVWNARTGGVIIVPVTSNHFQNLSDDLSRSKRYYSGRDSATSFTFFSEGNLVASGTYRGLISVWEVETGTAIRPSIQCHDAAVISMAFSPNGHQIISCSGDSRSFRVWNWRTGRGVGSSPEGHTSGISSLKFSPDGTKIISCSSREQLVWDATTYVRIYLNEIDLLHRRWIGDVSFLHLLEDGWVVDLVNTPVFWVPVEKRRAWAVHGSRVLLGGSRLTMLDISDVPV